MGCSLFSLLGATIVSFKVKKKTFSKNMNPLFLTEKVQSNSWIYIGVWLFTWEKKPVFIFYFYC